MELSASLRLCPGPWSYGERWPWPQPTTPTLILPLTHHLQAPTPQGCLKHMFVDTQLHLHPVPCEQSLPGMHQDVHTLSVEDLEGQSGERPLRTLRHRGLLGREVLLWLHPLGRYTAREQQGGTL